MDASDPVSGRTLDPAGEAPASPGAGSPSAQLRARAVHDVRHLRALAFAALRDGMPRGEVRAATARASARAVIAHARRLCSILEKYDRPWTRGLRRYPTE